jgi:anion-transporting  ArsA/GET3 family ATPase
VPVQGLFDKRLIFVTGKGGVGKSSVAIALGLVAARRGMRTIVAELASQERIQRAFDGNGAPAPGGGQQFVEVELAPDLFTISIDPQSAMEEYLRVKGGTVGQALGSTRLFQAFAMATPGMRELLSIGKVWELAQLERRTRGAAPYDLVIVDAPATGHGLGILRTPQTFADIARVGPIAHQGRTIAATIDDRTFTAIVAVATAEEMPVNETIALYEALVHDGLALDAVIVNSLYPQRFAAQEAVGLEGALAQTGETVVRSAVRAALSEHTRAQTQRKQIERLRQGLDAPLIELPFVFAEELGEAELELLADGLAEALA